MYRAIAEMGAAPITKGDRVVKLYYVTRGAQNIKEANFEVPWMDTYCML